MNLFIPYVILTLVSPCMFFRYLMRSIYDVMRQIRQNESQGKPDAAMKFTDDMKIACFWLVLMLLCACLTVVIMHVEFT